MRLRRPVLLALLAISAAGCGEKEVSAEDAPKRPSSTEERILATRYRAVAELLAQSDARGLCEFSTGEAAGRLRCEREPRVPRGLRALKPDYDELFVYSDLGATVLGAALKGRDDRLFVRFVHEGVPGDWPVGFIMTGYSG